MTELNVQAIDLERNWCESSAISTARSAPQHPFAVGMKWQSMSSLLENGIKGMENKRVPLLQMTYLMDDVGIPADYRHMNGSGVHTFALISSSGNSTFVKFHWVPTAGKHAFLAISQLKSMR